MSLPSEMSCNDLHAFISTKFPVAADILRNHFMDGALLSDSTTHELILIGIPLGIAKTILGVVRGELDINLLPSEQSLREALQNAISADAQHQQTHSHQNQVIVSPSHTSPLPNVEHDHLTLKNGGRSPTPLPTPSPTSPPQSQGTSQHQELVWSDLSLAAQTALRAALKHAQIYSQKSCESNPYYASINEAAKQLILEGKVTIADSKGHILELAKKSVNKTYAFKKGKSRSRCSQGGSELSLLSYNTAGDESLYVDKENDNKHPSYCLEGLGQESLLLNTSNMQNKRYSQSTKRRRTSNGNHQGQTQLMTNLLSNEVSDQENPNRDGNSYTLNGETLTVQHQNGTNVSEDLLNINQSQEEILKVLSQEPTTSVDTSLNSNPITSSQGHSYPTPATSATPVGSLTSSSSSTPGISKPNIYPTVPTHADLMAAVEAGVSMPEMTENTEHALLQQ